MLKGSSETTGPQAPSRDAGWRGGASSSNTCPHPDRARSCAAGTCRRGSRGGVGVRAMAISTTWQLPAGSSSAAQRLLHHTYSCCHHCRHWPASGRDLGRCTTPTLSQTHEFSRRTNTIGRHASKKGRPHLLCCAARASHRRAARWGWVVERQEMTGAAALSRVVASLCRPCPWPTSSTFSCPATD